MKLTRREILSMIDELWDLLDSRYPAADSSLILQYISCCKRSLSI